MDISKYCKPIHIVCPKCKYELTFNGGKEVAVKNQLKDEIQTIIAQMQTHRNIYGKDKYYHRLVQRLNEKNTQYTRAKQRVQLLSEQSEEDRYRLFVGKCRLVLGNETVQKLLEECEEEMFYRMTDLAKQKFTNFNGI